MLALFQSPQFISLSSLSAFHMATRRLAGLLLHRAAMSTTAEIRPRAAAIKR